MSARCPALLAAAAAIAVVVGLAPEARAQEDAQVDRLQAGRAQFQELEYRQTITTLAPLVDDADTPRAARLEALELIGISHRILGEDAKAKRAFRRILEVDPEYRLRHHDGSPKILDAFESVRRSMKPPPPPPPDVIDVTVTVPEKARAGQRIDVEVTIGEGGSEVREVAVLWRRGSFGRLEEVVARRVGDGSYRARLRLPESEVRYRLYYYVEARNIAGGYLVRAGRPDAPRELLVAADGGSDSWHEKWYVWAGGVALAGVGGFFVYRAFSGEDGSLDPGRVTLTP